MNENFIPYEEAVALKELGFDEEVLGNYYEYTQHTYDDPRSGDTIVFNEGSPIRLSTYNMCGREDNRYFMCKAPLWQQVFRWFNEKHDLDSSYGTTCDTDKNVHGYVISKFTADNRRVYLDKNWEVGTYEEAELACLKKLIEITKNGI